MLEYLKKQVFEYRSKNFLLRSDLNELKTAHNHLLEQYAGLTSSYEVLRKQSLSLSKSNKKLLGQSTESKKELYETKKELKISLFNHKAEMRKLADLMKAKDKDNASTIAHLQAEVASLKSLAKTNSSRRDSNTLSKTQKKRSSLSLQTLSSQETSKKVVNSSLKASKNNQINRTRAKFGRRNPTNVNTPTSSIDDEQWGHDGFFALNGSTSRSSPVSMSSSNSFSSSRQSITHKRHLKKTASKDAKKKNDKPPLRIVNSEQAHAPPNRSVSTSSLKEAIVKKTSDQNAGAKKSSLAAAATKRSSLALKVKNSKS